MDDIPVGWVFRYTIDTNATFDFRRTAIRAVEESQSQNAGGSQRSSQAQGNCQLIRTPFGIIVDRSSIQAQTPARTATLQNRPPITSATTISQPGYRPQTQGNTTNQTSPAGNRRMNLIVIRCCMFIIAVIIIAIVGGGLFSFVRQKHY